ncbi:uncharacterized protein LOC121431006 isoform X2 [Lytechinus variegatus]|uniref:uncharacterized protein LOC121431006 isoform X2 n=1 Tax=Lytechinus variegatus TaxID=7654 RepID=UPI001BB1B4BB|nr:uncharacterized protein LOC121431006 isoform X2 [Lytechinus variegatus]
MACVRVGSSSLSRWTESEGDVTCRSMGYSHGSSSTWCDGSTPDAFRHSSSLVLSLSCSGDEDNYLQCSSYDYSMYDYDTDNCEMVGVTCAHDPEQLILRQDKGNVVQSFEDGYWRTWCFDTGHRSNWTLNEGHVLCRMMEHSYALDIGTLPDNASVTSLIHFQLHCEGGEKHYSDCWSSTTNYPSSASCEVVTVYCAVDESGVLPEIRLMNGMNMVQTLHNDEWRTWCVWTSASSRWTLKEGHVVCRMMGQGQASAASVQSVDYIMNPVLQLEIYCNGNESDIRQCQYEDYLYRRTPDGECKAVHITCKQDATTNLTSPPTTPTNDQSTSSSAIIDMTSLEPIGSTAGVGPASEPNQGSHYLKTRLGPRLPLEPFAGVVEIGYQGTWGAVCYDGWSMAETQVVCRSLGYSHAIEFQPSFVDPVNVAVNDVKCTGAEENLAFCEYSSPPSYTSCGLTIAVKCSGTDDLKTRLVGEGESQNEGRVEVYYQGVWGAVGLNDWDTDDAHVVCRSVGYSRSLYYILLHTQGPGNIVLDNVRCTGNETNLAFCEHSGLYLRENSYQDFVAAGVKCDDQIPRIRFTSIPLGAWDPEDKMVEFYIDGDWKPLCQNATFSLNLDAICRTVGLMLYRVLQFIPNNNMNKEGVALHCPADVVDLSQCNSSSDFCEFVLGASCLSDPPAVRLTNGTGPGQGRAEVYFANEWMTLTAHPTSIAFDMSRHICREIGYSDLSVSYIDGSFGLNTDTVFANSVIQRPGDSQYVFLKDSAEKGVALGVACKEKENPITVDISIYEESKVVALVIGQDVRPVCLDGYLHLNHFADLACKNLGYQRAVMIQREEVWPEWNRFLWFPTCNERKLNDCKFFAFKTTCDHVLGLYCDIGVSVSLKGGEGDYDGLIELSLGNGLNLTGGVHNDPKESFYHTVCKGLGYEKAVYMMDNAPLGTLSNKFWEVSCPEDAADLSFCFINNARRFVNSGGQFTKGVICNAADALPVRLIEGDGIGTSTGIVEVRIFNEWTPLRLYYMYMDLPSNFVGVLCLQLDFSPYIYNMSSIHIDDDGGHNFPAYQVQCETNALDLRSCLFRNHKKVKHHEYKIHISCNPEPFNHCNLKDALYPCDARNGGCSPNGTKDVICWCKDGYTLDTDGHTCKESITKARFLNKTGPREGIPELFYGGHWFLVHYPRDTYISYQLRRNYDALCQMLGFKEMLRISGEDEFKFQEQIFLSQVICSDDVTSLQDCKRYSSQSLLSTGDSILRLLCLSADGFRIRLTGSSFPNRGRVEIAVNEEEWGGICKPSDMSKSHIYAAAFCKHLGFSTSLAELTEAQGSQGLPVFADQIRIPIYILNSFNLSLSFQKERDDCQTHLGVVCTEHIKTRLLLSSQMVQEGTPQVFLEENNTWADVCMDDYEIADWFCAQQGYSGLLSYTPPNTKMTSKYTYEHSKVYGYFIRRLTCSPPKLICNNGQALSIRLANGSAPFSGNVEIKYLGNWSLLTFGFMDHVFFYPAHSASIPFAEVTCSSLGYPEVHVYSYNHVEALTSTTNSILNNPVCSTRDINSCHFLSDAHCSGTTISTCSWLLFVTCNEESFNPCLQKGLLYPCDPNMGGCTMLVNHTYQCTCPSGMILDNNNKTCIEPQELPLQIVIGSLPSELKESFESLRKSLFDDDSLSNDTSSDESDSSVSVARKLDSFLDDMLEANITDLLHIVQDDVELIALPLDTKLDVQSINFGLDNESSSSLPKISIPIASLLEGHNGSLIAGAFALIKLKRNGTERIHHNVSDSSRSGYLNSDVVSIKLSGVNTTSLKQNISISFPTAETSGSGYSPHCSFLEGNEASGSTWSLRGCSRKNVAQEAYDDVITCTCNHLTSFAILMLTNIDATVASGKHSFILSLATYVGLAFSIISLVLSLMAFFISKVQTTRLFLMKNQCIAMILAQGLFATGVVQAKRITVLCGIVAGATHLLFLAVFAWMLNQGMYIMLQLGIRRLTHVQVKRWQYSVIGWGIPLAIIGITSAVDYRLYLDGNYCWLATVRGGAYAFIGPVLAVLMVNLGIFFYAISRFTSVKAFKNKSEKDKIRSTLRAVSVLCPILGITWALGLFVRVHISLEYSFTILNSSQGVLLFIFQVLLNEEVYAGVRRRLRRHIINPVGTVEASQTENKSVTKPTISTRQETKSSSDESGNMDMEVVSLKDE